MTIAPEAPVATDQPPAPARKRWWVLIAAVVTLLAVGAAFGVLLTRSRVGSPPVANAVDVGFAQDMRVHHEQAVLMAGIARDRTTDPSVNTLAFDIEGGQKGQIGMMTAWLISWGQPEQSADGRHMAWMTDSAHGHGDDASGRATMPGMATEAELEKLKSLSGKELDVYFLQLMLRHHQGGLGMAQYAEKFAAIDYLRNVATKIIQAQGHESSVITDMLTERGALPLRPPN
jgi:uncharacterized protein (DUF305 family)